MSGPRASAKIASSVHWNNIIGRPGWVSDPPPSDTSAAVVVLQRQVASLQSQLTALAGSIVRPAGQPAVTGLVSLPITVPDFTLRPLETYQQDYSLPEFTGGPVFLIPPAAVDYVVVSAGLVAAGTVRIFITNLNLTDFTHTQALWSVARIA